MQDRDCAVAMDVGGTQYRVAVVDQVGAIVAIQKGRTQARGGPQAAAERIIAAVREVVEEAGSPRLAGIGASMASPVDPATGVLHHPPNLPGWSPAPRVRIRMRTAAGLSTGTPERRW